MSSLITIQITIWMNYAFGANELRNFSPKMKWTRVVKRIIADDLPPKNRNKLGFTSVSSHKSHLRAFELGVGSF
jgi:hypothetical protein